MSLSKPVWVIPGRKPQSQVFSWRGSNNTCQWPWLVGLAVHPLWRHQSPLSLLPPSVPLCRNPDTPSSCPPEFHKLYEPVLSFQHLNLKCAASWQNQQNESAPAKTQISWASAQSNHSLRCLHEETLGPYIATHWVHSKDWSDWADAQADLSLCRAHTHFVGFVMLRPKYILNTLTRPA